MTIYIDYNFPNWNEYINAERSNRYKAANLKKKEIDIIRYSTIGLRYKGKYPIRITANKYYTNKKQDLDNMRIKGILDGLVKCGVIENDNLTKIQQIILNPIFNDTKEGIELIIEQI